MAHYVSVPHMVEAWRVPFWGKPAEEPAPSWLIQALQNDEIFVNHLGGLSRRTLFGDEDCYCGDYATIDDHNTISFVSADTFHSRHEKIRLA